MQTETTTPAPVVDFRYLVAMFPNFYDCILRHMLSPKDKVCLYYAYGWIQKDKNIREAMIADIIYYFPLLDYEMGCHSVGGRREENRLDWNERESLEKEILPRPVMIANRDKVASYMPRDTQLIYLWRFAIETWDSKHRTIRFGSKPNATTNFVEFFRKNLNSDYAKERKSGKASPRAKFVGLLSESFVEIIRALFAARTRWPSKLRGIIANELARNISLNNAWIRRGFIDDDYITRKNPVYRERGEVDLFSMKSRTMMCAKAMVEATFVMEVIDPRWDSSHTRPHSYGVDQDPVRCELPTAATLLLKEATGPSYNTWLPYSEFQ